MANITQSYCCFKSSHYKKACWLVTNKCSLKCKHCAQLSSPAMLANFKQLESQNIINITRKLKALDVKRVIVSGGEPTEYRHLLSVFDALREYNISYSMSTNGNSGSEHNYKTFREHGLERITISLDGFKPIIHDEIRGKGSFVTVISSIKNAVKLGINITVASFLHEKNNDHLRELFSICSELKVNELNLLAPINYNQCFFKNHNSSLEEKDFLEKIYSAVAICNNIKFDIILRFPKCKDDYCPSGNEIIGIFGDNIINSCVFKRFSNNDIIIDHDRV